MSKPKNAFEIFQSPDKSNCGTCGEKTCLAFAGAVFLGQKRIRECPTLSPEVLERSLSRRAPGNPTPRVASKN